MFDIGASELLLIVVVAIVVIGPKDLPMAMRMAGRWIAKMRRVSGYFRSGIETMIREAELEDMERKWREQNEAIMKAHPMSLEDGTAPPAGSAESAVPQSVSPPPASPQPAPRLTDPERAEPQLPLPPP